MIINQIAIPNKLNLFGKKQIPHLDTLSYGSSGLQAFYFFKVNVQE
jgi:hypothetical protein